MRPVIRDPHVVAIHGPDVAQDVDPEPRALQLDLRVPLGLSYFEGHFPGCELLPGVVQVHWALQFGRKHFAIPARVAYLANIKFMRVIVPGSPAALRLELHRTRHELRFEYRVGEHLCSSGAIGLAA